MNEFEKIEATREHPLWPAFEKWAAENLGPETMRSVYWSAFRAGAQAREDLIHARQQDIFSILNQLRQGQEKINRTLREISGGPGGGE